MLRYTLCLAVTLSCATPKQVSAPTSTNCKVLRLTDAPPLHFDGGVLPLEDRKALALWIADVNETRIGLDGCPSVQLVDE